MSAQGNGSSELSRWRDSTRVFLQPIAAPSILGLFGFAGATFVVAANLAGWFGNPTSSMYLWPFAAMFGGVAQFAAGMWAFKARDGIATAMHGTWGSFWMAYGLLFGLAGTGVIAVPIGAFTAFGYWMIVLAAITFFGFVAATAESAGLAGVLLALSLGSVFAAVHYIGGGSFWKGAAGWSWLVSSWLAIYTAGAMMIEAAFGRVVLPLGKPHRKGNVPGDEFTLPLEFERGEPGIRMGQ